jgi:hypothetical protein
MKECLYEKNVDFNTDYRTQKNVITSQIVCAVNIKLLNLLSFFFFKNILLTVNNCIIV